MKKFKIIIEIEALTQETIRNSLVNIIEDLKVYEAIIEERGFIQTEKSSDSLEHFEVHVTPCWEGPL